VVQGGGLTRTVNGALQLRLEFVFEERLGNFSLQLQLLCREEDGRRVSRSPSRENIKSNRITLM
jgi:hypothetical protein